MKYLIRGLLSKARLGESGNTQQESDSELEEPLCSILEKSQLEELDALAWKEGYDTGH